LTACGACGRGHGAGNVGPPPLSGGPRSDGGPTDGGPDTITVPTADGWTFYTAADGLTSAEVMGVTADEGGNLWVAGGASGLFVQRAGSKTFQRFGLADGLHPYGYMPDGSPSDKNPYLNAISVSGGPAGTAFVGYMGKTVAGALGCEDNWDGPNPDPAVYKSGDADKVTLGGSGISVVHYDIFSGPNVVGAETRGREKLCNIYRIVYQRGSNYVWFGGNHGFALGFADFAGNPTCNGLYPGMQASVNCAGVWEHVHPAVNGFAGNNDDRVWFLTSDYYGVSVDPLTQDIWFGGQIRTTRFRFATSAEATPIGKYYDAESRTEDRPYVANRIDVWPDQVTEPNIPRPSQRTDDSVSGIAGMPDGSAWIGSFARGLRRISGAGAMVEDATSKLLDVHVGAVVRDPSDGSIWIGYRWGSGVSRLLPDGSMRHYDGKVFGDQLAWSAVRDIQIQGSGASRKVLVAFEIGALGVFSGK
jgi:hypothetical protein